MVHPEIESSESPQIHPTAIVDETARIGKGCRIGAYCIIGPGVELGEGNWVMEHAVVTSAARLGKGNRIHHHAVIGGLPQDLKFHGEDSLVVIGDNNVFREFVTVNGGTQFGGGVTRIGSNNLIMAQAHIAHDCQLGDGIVMGNNTMLAGHVTLQHFVTMGGGCAVHQFSTIGRYSYLAGWTRVVQDIAPFLLVEGYNCKARGINVVGLRRFGYDKPRIEQLKQVFRLIFRSGEPRARALELIESRGNIPEEAREIVAFLRSAEKGKSGRAREVQRARDRQPAKGAEEWKAKRGALEGEDDQATPRGDSGSTN
ncbi:MAG: acyl-ACP--UDP-N-acetylglucosamine O-acyltransferase [Planctomycetota bacterium]